MLWPVAEPVCTAFAAPQEAFKGTVVDSSRFRYKPENPAGDTFLSQKWAWTGDKPGVCVCVCVGG